MGIAQCSVLIKVSPGRSPELSAPPGVKLFHLGQCSGSIPSGEPLLNTPSWGSREWTNSLFKNVCKWLLLAALRGVGGIAGRAGLSGLHCSSGDFAAHSSGSCLCNAPFSGSPVWVLSLNDGRRGWNDFSSVGLASSSECTCCSSGLHAWVMCWALDLFTRSAWTEIGSRFQSSSWALVCTPLWSFSNPRS